MKIKKIMSRKPVVLRKNDTLGKAARTLSANKISGCPVVDSKNNILGIVTQSDIIKAVDAYSGIKSGDFLSLIESVIKGDENAGFGKIKGMKISEFMKSDVISIEKDESIAAAAKLMNKHRIDRLIVLEGKKPAGIVTKSDIVDALGRMKN